VLALQGDFREHARILGRLGVEARLVRRGSELRGIDGLVIPGGESTTIGKMAERYDLVEPLREVVRAGIPTLGTCAGMIFLAKSTTGEPQTLLEVLDIVVERNAFGRQLESFETSLPVAGIARPVEAVFIRAPLVEKVGSDVEVLAAIDDKPVMVKQGRIVATSFHPELTDDTAVHEMFLEL
jgi:5'-phosphate synthase pdxT subunit